MEARSNKKKTNDNNEDNTNGKKEPEVDEMNEILEEIREYHERIVELETIEVDFDNERNSSFLELHKYRKKLMDLYYRGCEMKGIDADAGRPYLINKKFKITDDPFIDRVINDCINENCYNIPQFNDILNCIQYCNREQNVEISKAVETSYAEIAYVKVVESLQRMRQRDFYNNYTTIYEETEDPAKLNRRLWDKLIANEVVGKKKLNEVLEQFVHKQHEELVSQAAKRRRSNVAQRKTRKNPKKSPPKVEEDDDHTETKSESGDSNGTSFHDLLQDDRECVESSEFDDKSEKSEEFNSGDLKASPARENSAPNFAISTMIEQNPGTSHNVITFSRVNTERGDYKKIQVIDESRDNSVETSSDSITDYFRNQPDITEVKTEDEDGSMESSADEEKIKRRERCLLM